MTVESKAMDHIRKVLEQFGNKYFTSSGALKRTAVIEDLDSYDKDLMTALLSDDLLHKTYTSKIADVEIFEINKFVDMLKYKEYWADSFTKFNNKIGLTAGGKYIDDSEDVVLDFPYKDTVLKAGMTKEDVEHSGDADEPFLNETLAKPEIDELLEPKVLVNATKYDKNGKVKATSINGQDNLVVKGNNLIALYSLKERYAGKIKLIYLMLYGIMQNKVRMMNASLPITIIIYLYMLEIKIIYLVFLKHVRLKTIKLIEILMMILKDYGDLAM